MMCYKDKTFCPFHEHCNNGIGCPQALNDKVREGAMQAGMDISRFVYPPTVCFSEKENNPIVWVDGIAQTN